MGESAGGHAVGAAGRALTALAGMAPDARPKGQRVVPTSTTRWVPLSYTNVFRGGSGVVMNRELGEAAGIPSDENTRRILKVARVRDDGALRLGWLWVAGTGDDGTRHFFPLVSIAVVRPIGQPVANAVLRVLVSAAEFVDIEARGEPELTDLVTSAEDRLALASISYGGDEFVDEWRPSVARSRVRASKPLEHWAQRAATAAGVPGATLIPANGPPEQMAAQRGLWVVAAVGLYLAEPVVGPITTAATLRAWGERDIDGTAFARLYADTDPSAADLTSTGEPVDSPLLLTRDQETAVRAARQRHVSVVSGPPGTGKSQTVAAIACDAVARGESVLVAAPSDAAVDALVDLLRRTPGPDPIVFGASVLRADLAARLGQGGADWVDDATVERLAARRDAAIARRNSIRRSIEALLDAEQSAADADPATAMIGRQRAPGLFETDADLVAARAELDRSRRTGGWWQRRRARAARRDLVTRARADASEPLDDLAWLLDLAVRRRHAAELEAGGGLAIGELWAELHQADDDARTAVGEWLDAFARDEGRVSRRSRLVMGEVAAALRSGRSQRRQQLAQTPGRELTAALPLWVGTLRDIDDLLPTAAAMFDLVVIDESSQVDQVSAAPALLRATRAVIVGDPRQLRHVSFLSDERIAAALTAAGVTDPSAAAQLDARRMSAFDAGAAVAPVHFLADHFRSVPHLIEFSARHFYDGQLVVATRHPRNDDLDAIEVEHVGGTRNEAGVNRAEIERVLALVRAEVEHGASSPGSIGVVAPSRSQADAIEDAVVEQFDLHELDAIDLRVGSVHGFQGCERRTVLVSLGIDADTPTGSRRFVNDPNLFNVMVTRARDRLHVLSSVGDTASGLLEAFIRHADVVRQGAPRGLGEPTAWTSQIAAELRRAGVPVTVGYPIGINSVDLVVGRGSDAVGVICAVHPQGPSAHVDRQLVLRRAGWRLHDAFATRWRGREAELVVALSLETRGSG